MTDFEKLKALFTEFGIEFSEYGNEILCEQGNKKIAGYWGFSTTFCFDENGQFIEMGAYE